MVKKNKKIISKVFFVILLVVVSIFLYLSRWTLSYNFDPVYWENAYYESQWNVPNSPRGIGDDGVYRYIGYRLVNNGENPFNVDFWVPPLGKYTYGLSAKFLNNPYITTLIYYLGSIFVFYLISKYIFPKPYHLISTLLFASNPLIVNEIQTTMLDLPLTFFFLLFLYFFIKFLSSKKYNLLYLSALSLGLMSGIKPQFFIPMFTLVAVFFLLKDKQFKKIPIFFIFIFIGYVFSYFCYFIKHPNPIPWIRLHQKIIEFQGNNGGSHDILNILRFTFTREYRGYWVNAKSYWPTNWSIIIPIGLLSSLTLFFKFIKKKKLPKWVIFSSLIIIFYYLMNLMIDFWPRYLVPIVPLFIIVTLFFFKKKHIILTLIFLSYIPFLYLFFFPKPNDFVASFKNLYESNFYKDTYQQLDSQSKEKVNITEWKDISNKKSFFDDNLEAVKEKNQWRMKIKF